ncbi:MAG: YmdB family metallophosphoesterase [Treponema sp.]|nr:YmdB family metallophosphoesterase [Treponema sp.]
MKVLYIAEIVGKAGVHAVKKGLKGIKQETGASFVIACADGATSGNGLGRNHAAYLRKLDVDVITTGECCFYKKDLVENIEKLPFVLRPENLNSTAPGRGIRVFKAGNVKIAVLVIIGQSGFIRLHGENPVARLPVLLERLRQETPVIIIDFHAGATAEKRTLFAAADGKCSAVIGSHTRVQTADEEVLPGGTAVITDAGRTGSANSVGGTEIESRIREYLTGIPDWTREAWENPELQGVLLDIGADGRSLSISRIKRPVEPMAVLPVRREAGGDDGDGGSVPGDDKEDAGGGPA